MEKSEALQETLNLGKKIVHELSLDRSNNNLGRWLSHYIADLIAQAEVETDPEKKQMIQRECCDRILKVWEVTKDRYDRLNPLADLKSVITILANLKEDDNSFWRFYERGDLKDPFSKFADTIDNTAYKLLNSSVILSLLPDKFINAQNWYDNYEDILTNEEKELIDSLRLLLIKDNRLEMFFEERSKKKENENIISIIDQMDDLLKEQMVALDELRKRINGSDEHIIVEI